jgi:hypothetical protein
MSTQCYGIDGTPYATFDRYIPCNSTGAAVGQHTSCCAPGDICLTNGLCQSQGDNNRKANLFWRNGCTDPTWNDPACPKHCEGLGVWPYGMFVMVSTNLRINRQARHSCRILLPQSRFLVLFHWITCRRHCSQHNMLQSVRPHFQRRGSLGVYNRGN